MLLFVQLYQTNLSFGLVALGSRLRAQPKARMQMLTLGSIRFSTIVIGLQIRLIFLFICEVVVFNCCNHIQTTHNCLLEKSQPWSHVEKAIMENDCKHLHKQQVYFLKKGKIPYISSIYPQNLCHFLCILLFRVKFCSHVQINWGAKDKIYNTHTTRKLCIIQESENMTGNLGSHRLLYLGID